MKLEKLSIWKRMVAMTANDRRYILIFYGFETLNLII